VKSFKEEKIAHSSLVERNKGLGFMVWMRELTAFDISHNPTIGIDPVT
jgi:hypothetical protein